MREIRFRFFSPYGDGMRAEHDGWTEGIGINEALECSEEYGYKIMQYTGLKDSKGVEIYEGDIVDEKYRVVVYFIDGQFKVKSNMASFVPKRLIGFLNLRENALCPVEVIGNIYETPNLLREEVE